jgi:hypothetical protein
MDDVQEIDLSGPPRERIELALLEAFDHDDMERMLRLKLNIKIREEMFYDKDLRSLSLT